MKPTHRHLFVVASVSIAAYAVYLQGCSDDFTTFSHLDRLRVMAIQSDPATPLPGEPVQITPLVYVPSGKKTEYAWSWCPLPTRSEDGYQCPLTEKGLARSLGPLGFDEPIAFDLGNDPTAVFDNPFDPTLLGRVCDEGIDTGEISPDVWCRTDFPIQVMLKVKTPTESLTSVVTLHLPIEEGTAGNTNPEIDGIRIVKPTPVRELDDQGAIIVHRQDEVTFEAIVPEEASESFIDKDEDGKSVKRRERLTVSWFSEAGEWDAQRASFIEGVMDLRSATRNKWIAPKTKDYKKERVKILVVVRDDRGGVNWTSGQITLEDAP
jgi:hypothetical protein